MPILPTPHRNLKFDSDLADGRGLRCYRCSWSCSASTMCKSVSPRMLEESHNIKMTTMAMYSRDSPLAILHGAFGVSILSYPWSFLKLRPGSWSIFSTLTKFEIIIERETDTSRTALCGDRGHEVQSQLEFWILMKVSCFFCLVMFPRCSVHIATRCPIPTQWHHEYLIGQEPLLCQIKVRSC